MHHQKGAVTERPVELLDSRPEPRCKLLVGNDDLAVPEVVLVLDAVDLIAELNNVTVPAIHDRKVRVVHTRQAGCHEELAPRVCLDALDSASVRLPQERDRALAIGHGAMCDGAPYPASTSGTPPWKFSRIASSALSVTIVPLSVWGVPSPDSPRLRMPSLRAWKSVVFEHDVTSR